MKDLSNVFTAVMLSTAVNPSSTITSGGKSTHNAMSAARNSNQMRVSRGLKNNRAKLLRSAGKIFGSSICNWKASK